MLSSSFIILQVEINSLAGGVSRWLLCQYPHYLIYSDIFHGPWIPEDEGDVISKRREPLIQRRNVKSQKRGNVTTLLAVQIATLARILRQRMLALLTADGGIAANAYSHLP